MKCFVYVCVYVGFGSRHDMVWRQLRSHSGQSSRDPLLRSTNFSLSLSLSLSLFVYTVELSMHNCDWLIFRVLCFVISSDFLRPLTLLDFSDNFINSNGLLQTSAHYVSRWLIDLDSIGFVCVVICLYKYSIFKTRFFWVNTRSWRIVVLVNFNLVLRIGWKRCKMELQRHKLTSDKIIPVRLLNESYNPRNLGTRRQRKYMRKILIDE